MLPFVPPDDAAVYESTEGRTFLWFPAPGLVAARCMGHVTGEVARLVYALIDAQPVFPNEGFLDMVETTGFDWGARGRALKWNILHMSTKTRLHILVVSPPLILATRVFERALGDHVELHTAPAGFESAYNIAIRKRTRVKLSEPPQ